MSNVRFNQNIRVPIPVAAVNYSDGMVGLQEPRHGSRTYKTVSTEHQNWQPFIFMRSRINQSCGQYKNNTPYYGWEYKRPQRSHCSNFLLSFLKDVDAVSCIRGENSTVCRIVKGNSQMKEVGRFKNLSCVNKDSYFVEEIKTRVVSRHNTFSIISMKVTKKISQKKKEKNI